MSNYTWKTEMRHSTASARTSAELEELQAARAADKLRGQAAARRLEDGRWCITVMPDRSTFAQDCVVSADDMRALAHATLDADRHPLEAPALARVEIIDVAEHARQIYGGQEKADYITGRTLPEHDYRFRGVSPAGRESSYHDDATATHVMQAIEHDRELKAKGL